MDPRPANPPSESGSPLELEDEESFRQALQMLLTVASREGVPVSNQSWKCVSSETGRTWDVEITTVESA